MKWQSRQREMQKNFLGNFCEESLWRKKMKINPIDKVDDLIQQVKEYNPVVHTNSDKEYDWLEEGNICVEIPNPSSDNPLEIEFQNGGEFIVFFSGGHSHYWCDDEYYNLLCELVVDILNNIKCSASLFYGDENKWMGSSFVDRE